MAVWAKKKKLLKTKGGKKGGEYPCWTRNAITVADSSGERFQTKKGTFWFKKTGRKVTLGEKQNACEPEGGKKGGWRKTDIRRKN